tara:strand:- start:57 stop:431 length:375 start_codon:yes stop_codon:yes gene_type:complete
VLLALWKIKDILSLFSNDVEAKSTFGATISNGDAVQRANDIYNSLGVLDDDEERIFKALEYVTIPDYNKIYNAYGKKTHYSINRNENITNGDLTETLKRFLQDDDIDKLLLINPLLKPVFYDVL